MEREKWCNLCLEPYTSYLHTLCQKCFERGAKIEPPRQTGRTIKLLQGLLDDPDAVMFFPNHHQVRHYRSLYEQIASRIQCLCRHELDNIMRRGERPILDHTCYEGTGESSEIEHARQALKLYEERNLGKVSK